MPWSLGSLGPNDETAEATCDCCDLEGPVRLNDTESTRD